MFRNTPISMGPNLSVSRSSQNRQYTQVVSRNTEPTYLSCTFGTFGIMRLCDVYQSSRVWRGKPFTYEYVHIYRRCRPQRVMSDQRNTETRGLLVWESMSSVQLLNVPSSTYTILAPTSCSQSDKNQMYRKQARHIPLVTKVGIKV
jgi:hypothetical protein